jgi:hypothetical protein
MTKDKRKSRRFGVKNSTVNYKKAGIPHSLFSGESPAYLILNMSETGIHFITKESLQVGTVLRLNRGAPNLDNRISTKARVIWVRKSEEHDAYRVGVEFTKISRKSKSLLKNVIDNAILDNVELSTKIYLKEIERL